MIDESFEFKFSLSKDTLIAVNKTGKPEDEILGYYNSCHRSTGALNLEAYDGSIKWSGIGAKTLSYIKKYYVDIFGYRYEVKKEKRLEIKKKQKKGQNELANIEHQ